MGQRFDSLDALAQAATIARELKLPAERLDPLRDEAIACMALPDLKPTGRVIHRPPGAIGVAFDSTMTRYALRFRDGTIQVRRVADDEEIARFTRRGDREFFVFGFSPDGRYLATTHLPGFALTVWDIEQRHGLPERPGPVSRLSRPEFSPDSRRIALAHVDGELLVYDLATGHSSRRWRGPGAAQDLAFRPDGTQIAVIYNGTRPSCQIIEAESGKLVRSIPLPTRSESVAWSPDGTTLATPCDDRKIYLWDAATGIRRATLEGSTNLGLRAAFHPAGTLLASNGWEGRLRLWDAVLGRPVLSLTGGSLLEFSKDGRIVVGIEDQLTSYQVDPALEYRTFAHVSSQSIDYRHAAIRRDGRVLAVGTSRGVALWDLAHGAELAFLPIGNAWHVIFEASGDLLTERVDRRAAVAHSARPRPGRIPHRPTAPAPVAGGRLRRSPRTGWAGSWPCPTMTLPSSRLPSGRSIWGRWTTAATSPSARTDNGWRPAVIIATKGAQVWRIGDATKVAELPVDYRHRGRLQPRWKMADDDHRAVPALDGRHLARGAADRRRRSLFLPRRPPGGRRGRDQGHSPGRDRDRPHGRAARKPRPVRGLRGQLQPRRLAPGGHHQ